MPLLRKFNFQGASYDVPDDETEAFNAVSGGGGDEVRSYRDSDGKDYDVPASEDDAFKAVTAASGKKISPMLRYRLKGDDGKYTDFILRDHSVEMVDPNSDRAKHKAARDEFATLDDETAGHAFWRGLGLGLKQRGQIIGNTLAQIPGGVAHSMSLIGDAASTLLGGDFTKAGRAVDEYFTQGMKEKQQAMSGAFFGDERVVDPDTGRVSFQPAAPEQRTKFDEMVSSAVESASTSIAVGALFGPAAKFAVPLLYANSRAHEVYDNAKYNGMPTKQRLALAATAALAEGIPEYISSKFGGEVDAASEFLRGGVKRLEKEFLKHLGKEIAVESGTEFFQESAGNLVDQLADGKKLKDLDFGEATAAGLMAAGSAAISVGAMNAPNVQQTVSMYRDYAKSIEEQESKIRSARDKAAFDRALDRVFPNDGASKSSGPSSVREWAEANPEKAQLLLSLDHAPSRKDWDAAGLPRVSAEDRAAFVNGLRNLQSSGEQLTSSIVLDDGTTFRPDETVKPGNYTYNGESVLVQKEMPASEAFAESQIPSGESQISTDELQNNQLLFQRIPDKDQGEAQSETPQSSTSQSSTSAPSQINSAGTSLSQNPAGNKKAAAAGVFKAGTRNIDIGAGKYDKGSEFLSSLGVTNIPFDPFNRSEDENRAAVDSLKDEKADTATCHNVLNTISSDDAMDNVVNQAARAIKPDGTAVFSVYTGDSSGKGRETSKGFQRNWTTKRYVPFIQKYFDDVTVKDGVIYARKPHSDHDSVWGLDSSFNNTLRFQRMSSESSPLNSSPSPQSLARKPDDIAEHYFENQVADGMPGNIIASDEVRRQLNGKYTTPDEEARLNPVAYPVLDKVFDKALKERKGVGNGRVIFTMGGNAAGKSTFLRKFAPAADFVFDSTGGGDVLTKSGLAEKIQKVIDNGQKPVLAFVYRDPVQALDSVFSRYEKGGHLVSADAFARTHVKSRENLDLLINRFGDKIDVKICDNEQGGREISLDELHAKPVVTEEQLHELYRQKSLGNDAGGKQGVSRRVVQTRIGVSSRSGRERSTGEGRESGAGEGSLEARESVESPDILAPQAPSRGKRSRVSRTVEQFADRKGVADPKRRTELKKEVSSYQKFSKEYRELYADALDFGKWKAVLDFAHKHGMPLAGNVLTEYFTEPKFNVRKLAGLVIARPEDAAAVLMTVRSPFVESVKAIYLDKDNRVLDARILGVGAVSFVSTPSGLVTRNMPKGTASIIFSHNHPSGNPRPSVQDISLTNLLSVEAKHAGVKLVDHIITDGDKFYSFDNERLMPIKAKKPKWEVLPAGSDSYIRQDFHSGDDILSFVASHLRDDRDYGHVIYLTPHLEILGVRRILPAPSSDEYVSAWVDYVAQYADVSGAEGVFLDLGPELLSHDRSVSLTHAAADALLSRGIMHVHDAFHGGGSDTLVRSVRMNSKTDWSKIDSRTASAEPSLSGWSAEEPVSTYWDPNFPDATAQTSRKFINDHYAELFKRAKSGDVEAAEDLIEKVCKVDKIRQLGKDHPNARIVAPVIAQEASGHNQIPRIFAKYVASILGIETDTSIVQTVRANHTGADAITRLFVNPEFDGKVEKGAEYIIVDDHITQGGTVNALRDHIERNGGRVVAVASLTLSQGSSKLSPRKETLDELKQKWPDIDKLLQDAGIAESARGLTESQAKYILKFSPDTFRNRAIAQGNEGGGRTRREALGASPSPEVKSGEPRLQRKSGAPVSGSTEVGTKALKPQVKRVAEALSHFLGAKLSVISGNRESDFVEFAKEQKMRLLRNDEGIVLGAYDPTSNHIILSKDARLDTAFHEGLGHVIYARAMHGDKELRQLCKGLYDEAPQWLKDYVRETYGDLSPDVFMDEVFTHYLTSGENLETLAEKFGGDENAANSSKVRKWWNNVCDFFRKLWNKITGGEVTSERYAGMEPVEAFAQMVEDAKNGKVLGEAKLNEKKRLVINKDGQLFSGDKDNSASNIPTDGDGAEGISPKTEIIFQQDSESVNGKFRRSLVTPEEDAAYMDAVKRGDIETAQRMVREAAAKACPGNKVVDKKGLPLVLYHGTPSGGFTKFKYPTAYLSPDKSYADRYQSPSASSIRFGKSASNPMTMKVFLLSDHLFDTRKASDRRTFFNRYVQGGEEWNPVSGFYTKLSKKGLPDWTEGEALADFIHATRRKNDAIIVDEGGYFDLEGNVVDRGISYVALDTSKIKSADPVTYDDAGNVIPLSQRFNEENDDIRFQRVPSASAAEVQRQYDEVVARYTNADGTRKQGWMKAPNGKPTNLTERQWVQVRTENFKRWFGDWEKSSELLVDANGITKQEALSRLNRVLGIPLVNLETGIEAVINTSQRNKIVSNAASRKSADNGFDFRIHDAAAAIIDSLWKHASLFEARSDKDSDPNIKSIKRFIAPFRYGQNVAFAYITAKESIQDGHRVYSLELESVKAIEGMLATLKEQSPASTTLTKNRLQQLLDSVKPENVSKVVDENGEPMVVWHETDWNIYDGNPAEAVFKIDESTNGVAWFASRKSRKGLEAGENAYPFFLNIVNPKTISGDSYFAAEMNDEGLENGDDGAIFNDSSDRNRNVYTVRKPSQIKSATDNIGTFDGANPDIRFQRIPAASREACVAKFRELFPDVEFRSRKVTKDLGVGYDPNAKLIRTNDYNLDQMAEQLGYHIHDNCTLNLPPAVATAIEQIGFRVDPHLTSASAAQRVGVARVVGNYLSNGSLDPAVASWFNGQFGDDNPKIRVNLEKMRRSLAAFQALTPEEQVRSFRSAKNPNALVSAVHWMRAALSKHEWVDKHYFLLQGMRDSGIDIDLFDKNLSPDARARAITTNPYLAATVFNKTSGWRIANMALSGTTDIFGVRKTGSSLHDCLSSVLGKDYENFLDYATARVAQTYHDRGLASGLDPATADAVVTRLETPEFKQALDSVTEWSRNVLNLLVDTGVLLPAEYRQIADTNEVYLPFMRRFLEGDLYSRKAYKNGKAVHSRVGGLQNIENPLEALLFQSQKILAKAQQAQVIKACIQSMTFAGPDSSIAKWMVEIPAPEGSESAFGVTVSGRLGHQDITADLGDILQQFGLSVDPNADPRQLQAFARTAKLLSDASAYDGRHQVASVVIDGQRRFFEVKDPRLADLLNGFTEASEEGIIQKVSRTLTNSVRFGATLMNPKFGLIRNPIRDTLTAFLFSDYHTHIPAVSSIAGIVRDMTGSKYAELYNQMGLSSDTLSAQTLNQSHDLAGQVTSANKLQQAWRRGLLRSAASILSIPEIGPRVMEFEAAYKYWMARTGGDETAAGIMAACASSDLTVNFRKGGKTSEKVSQFVLFANAGIQSIDKFGRQLGLLSKMPWEKNKSGFRRFGRTLLRAGGLITLASLLSYLRYRDDDDWKNMSPWEKYNYFHFKGLDGSFVRLPLPFEPGLVFGSLPIAFCEQLSGRNPKAVEECLSVMAQMSPFNVGNIHDVLSNWTALAPLMDIACNCDYKGMPIVPETTMESKPVPDWYDSKTSKAAIKLGQILWPMVKDTKFEKMAAPAFIEHVVNSYSGGLYKGLASLFSDIADPSIINAADDHSTIPLVGTLFTPPSADRRLSDYYERKTELKRKIASKSATAAELGEYRVMQSFEDPIREALRKRRDVVHDPDLNAGERHAAQLKHLHEAQDAVQNYLDLRKPEEYAVTGAGSAAWKLTDPSCDEKTRAESLRVLKGMTQDEVLDSLREYAWKRGMSVKLRTKNGKLTSFGKRFYKCSDIFRDLNQEPPSEE